MSSRNSSSNGDIVIVGAGIAGLATAFEILQRDPRANVRTVEAASQPGGNIRTDHIDGFTVEWGPNGFLDNVPETLELVERLGISDRLQPADILSKKRFIWRNGRLHEIKANPVSFMLSGLISPLGKLRLLGEPFADTRPSYEETVYEFATRHIGEESARILVDAMVSGVFGGNARELSLQSAFPKMHEMETEYGSLTRAMFGRIRDRKAGRIKGATGGPSGPAGHLTSFKDGMCDLISALVRHIGPERIVCGKKVTQVTWHGPNDLTVKTDDGGQLSASAVIVAIPAWNAAPLVRDISQPLASTLEEIPGAPLIVVALGFPRASFQHALDGFGFLVPRGEGLTILGSLWTSSIFPGRASTEHVLLRTMVGGAHCPELIERTDDELTEIVLNDLSIAMGDTGAPIFKRIYRHAKGIPQYSIGHSRRVDFAEAVCVEHTGLYVTGNSYRGIAVNACIKESGPLAERVLASK